MPQMSKVELYAAIRRDHRGGMKIREIERKDSGSWRTVRKAVDSVWPEPRKKLPPRPTALDPYKPVIDGMLQADLDAPREQRHTITRTFTDWSRNTRRTSPTKWSADTSPTGNRRSS
ncbi:hypothetical protein [Streptomyces sp. NPDC055134]